jgi:hypothetical protein
MQFQLFKDHQRSNLNGNKNMIESRFGPECEWTDSLLHFTDEEDWKLTPSEENNEKCGPTFCHVLMTMIPIMKHQKTIAVPQRVTTVKNAAVRRPLRSNQFHQTIGTD